MDEQPMPPQETPENEPSETATSYTDRQGYRKVVWQGKIGPAFWTITGILSLGLNAILIAIVILLGREIFAVKNLVGEQLVGGLAQNFALMDEAVIRTNVVVNDQIPVQFTLPVSKKTTVVLTSDILISGANVSLRTGGLSIANAPTDITLPAGTPLDIKLDMQIPVDTTIPVTLNVPVDIPLNQTDLHEPFVGLQQVIAPYNSLLENLPDSWEEMLCQEGINRFCLQTQQGNLPLILND
jgi:hypothetical protein